MAGRKGRPAKATQAQTLLDALAFIEPGTNDFNDWQKFIRLSGNMAVSFNGQIAAGHPVAEEVGLCPQLDKLMPALKRCGKSLIISETPNGSLSIKGDKLRALVPCLADQSELPNIQPDPPIDGMVFDDRIKEAFRVCGIISSEAGETVEEASLLLEANVCSSIGKNKQLLLQYWHGIDLPPHMVLPKAFVAAVNKTAKPITGFGFSWQDEIVASVTFWFEGGAWIKTQCYKDRWPDIYEVLNKPSYPVELHGDLFDAIEAVATFNDDGTVIFADGFIMSHSSSDIGAQYEVKGLQGGKSFNGAQMKKVAPLVKTIDLTTYPDRAFFFGDNVRGVSMGLATHYVQKTEEPSEPAGAWNQTNTEACPHCNDEGDGCEHCT